MDIGSGGNWPSCALSNFAPHPFEIDGVKCKILTGKELTSTEVSQLVWEDIGINITQIDSVVIDEGRWDVTEEVIFKINGRYFSIYYLRGKTEMQEDYFPKQIAEEVEPTEIKVIRWIPKRKERLEELDNEQDICHRLKTLE